jgi:[ribosomal protein S5]-alanine N-acetyltransferase
MKVIRCKPGHELILANYHSVNERHFRKWSPATPRNHHTIEAWTRRLEEQQVRFENGSAAYFIATDETESYVIGFCSLTNIVRGVFQACHMGYSIAERFEGQGLMK